MSAHPASPSRRRWGPRLLGVTAAAIVAAAAVTVPLPFELTAPGQLVDIDDAVVIHTDEAAPAGAAAAPAGGYLGVRSVSEPSAWRLLTAAAHPGWVVRPASASAHDEADPVAFAAFSAAGMSPARADAAGAAPGVDTEITGVDPRSLSVALSVFDRLSDADLAHGRLIAAVGTLDSDGRTRCPTAPVARTVTEAAAAGVDVLLVPRACEDAPDPDGPGLRIVEAADLPDAVTALCQPEDSCPVTNQHQKEHR